MATGSHRINLDTLPSSIAPTHAIRPPRDLIARVGTAGLDLANDLLSRSVVSVALAEQSAERFRQHARALDVTFWMITGASAACVVRVGDHAGGHVLPTISFPEHDSVGQRLRRPGAIVCRAGEVTGAEDLAPAAARSYAMVSCVNDAGVAGVLALGWDLASPPVDDTAVSQLQIAAIALLRTLQAERAATSRVAAAQEEERSRIARELHDDLGQQTAVLSAKIEMLLRSSKASASRLRDGIVDARQNVQDLAVSIHNLSHELHPPKLKLLGLVKTLESLSKNVSHGSDVSVTFHSTPVPAGIPGHISLCICRVAQEALQNAVKHSGAREIEMVLHATDAELLLRVSDAGRGFDPSAPAGAGIGLTTMRERVELIGGQLRVQASPFGGATIEASVPLTPSR